jgi:hypothetical protein
MNGFSRQSATDYSYYVISLTAMIKQYQNLVSKGKYNDATGVVVDMQTAVIRLQQWTEAQIDQRAT